MKKSRLKTLLIVSGILCCSGLLLSGGAYLIGGRYPAYWCNQRSHMLSTKFWHDWNNRWDDYSDEVEEYWEDWGEDFENEFENRFNHFSHRYGNIEYNNGIYDVEYMRGLKTQYADSIVTLQQVSQLKFESVEMDILSSDIEIRYGDVTRLEVENIDELDEDQFLIFKDGDTLHIVENGNNHDGKIILTLAMSLQEVDIDTLSGDTLIEGGNYQELSLSSTSGNIDLVDVEVVDVESESTSGSLRMNQVVASSLSASLTSGSVELDNAFIDELDVSLSSGNVKGNGRIAALDISGTSGYVDLRLDGAMEDYDVDVMASNIEVGDRQAYGELEVASNKEQSIDVSLTSGEVNIRFTK